jgi:hypothetical protein
MDINLKNGFTVLLSNEWKCVLQWSTHLQIMGDKMKDIEMGRECGVHGVMRNVYKILVKKSEGKRPFKRPMQRGGKY